MPGGVECPAAPTGFDDDADLRRGGDESVAQQEPVTHRGHPRCRFGHDGTDGEYLVEQFGIRRRVEAVDSSGHERHRRCFASDGGTVGGRVDSERTAGDDGDSSSGKVPRKVGGAFGSVAAGCSGTDDGNSTIQHSAERSFSTHPQTQRCGGTEVVEHSGPLLVLGNDQAPAYSCDRVQIIPLRLGFPGSHRPPVDGLCHLPVFGCLGAGGGQTLHGIVSSCLTTTNGHDDRQCGDRPDPIDEPLEQTVPWLTDAQK